MFKLRDYQENCINKVMEMKEGEKKIACLPTGAGKTILMAEICRRAKGRILIIVMNTELRQQTIDKLKMVCGNNADIGSVQGNLKEWDHRIVVATRQTLTSGNKPEFRFLRLLQAGKFKYVLLDECHTALKQCKTIMDNINKDCKFCGFTATPYTKDLKKLYTEFIYKRELIDMIKDKYLVEPKCYLVNSNTNLNNVKVVRGDFAEGQLANTVNNEYRNNLIVKSYIEKCHVNGRNKTIIFCVTVDHAKAVAECFNKQGIKASSIDGSVSKKDREKIFKDFETGKIEVLTNVNICTIGLDIPSIDSIIFARPTKSKALYVQMLGRGLRLSPETNKIDCLVIDVVDVVTKHNIVTSKTIFYVEDGETPIKVIKRKARQEKIIIEDQLKKQDEIQNNDNKETIKEAEQGTNINNIDINYKEENILVERDIKENYGKYTICKDKDNFKNKADKEDNNKKSIINNLFRKIFKFGL